MVGSYRFEHLVRQADGKPDVDPVAGRRARYVMGRETVLREPFINCVHAILVRRYQSLNLILREVGTIPHVERITEYQFSAS